MIWQAANEPGVASEIGTLLDGLTQPGAKSWLDVGQRASLAGLRDRLCDGDKMGSKPGAILADEVGMGKTRIAVALALSVTRAGGRVAVLVPPGLIHQWVREFRYVFSMVRESDDRLQIARPIDTLLADDVSNLAKASVVLLPHGLLNFRMAAGHGTEKRVKQYASLLRACRDFSGDLLKDSERDELTEAQGLGPELKATHLKNSGCFRKSFISLLLSRLGYFNLLVIDEAHKSKRDDEAPDGAGENNLAQLLHRLERSGPKRLCLTATPFELGAENWAQILKRAGASDGEAKKCRVASEKFLLALKQVQLVPNCDQLKAFEEASCDFKEMLSPWLIRRRKAVAGDDSVLARYIRDHGPNYREKVHTIKAKISDAAWPRAIMAVEALSMMPKTDLPKQKWLRLALARGFSLATAVGAINGKEVSDWSKKDQQSLKDETAPPDADAPNDRRKARANFWLKAMGSAAASPYSHPTLLATVEAIEKIATGDRPEKVLVFGRFTDALKNLTDLLNAREMIRRLVLFKNNPEAPPSTWFWPGEVIPSEHNLLNDEGGFPAAFKAARAMGDTTYEELKTLIKTQYEKHRYRREKDFEHIREFVKGSKEPILRSICKDGKLQSLEWALIEIMDDHRALGTTPAPKDAWAEFKMGLEQMEEDAGDVDELEEDAGDVEDPSQKAKIYDVLEEYQGRSGRFARLLRGSMEASTKQHLQNTFNRRTSWPMVLVAQSLVGREGLNLHKSCRSVVLFQPEWNPGVVEQQIGRVDRMGSLWEEMVRDKPNDGEICIRVMPVIFPGTYDEHNWQVLTSRWDDYRAQMCGEVFSTNGSDNAELAFKSKANAAAPDFAP